MGKVREQFDTHFDEVKPKKMVDFLNNYKAGILFAFDLRDGSDFQLDESHEENLLKMINSGYFVFGTEKPATIDYGGKFPNGFTSWMETHHEIVSKIAREMIHVNIKSNVIHERFKKQGTGGLYELAEELTNKFENQYKDETWEENDWFDTMSKFLNKELN
jgi:hypothetical protein